MKKKVLLSVLVTRHSTLFTRGFHSASGTWLLGAWALNGEPGADRHVCAGKGVGASVYERCSVRRKPGEFRPPEKTVEHIGGHGMARFNLHGIEKPGFLNQEIDLVPCPVAPEEQGRRAAVVEIGLYDLCDHVVLEDCPPSGCDTIWPASRMPRS